MYLVSGRKIKENINREDKEVFNKKKISVEDTLELLYVRYQRDKLDKEIEKIFGPED